MNKEKPRTAPQRAPKRYQYADEGPYWLARRLGVMRDTLTSRRGYTLSSDALRKEGHPVVKAAREYLETHGPSLAQRTFRRLQKSLAQYEAEAL